MKSLEDIKAELEQDVNFENIEVLTGGITLYHSTSYKLADAIDDNGFMGFKPDSETLYSGSSVSNLSNDLDSVIFTTDKYQKDYGNAVFKINVSECIKCTHNEYNETEYIIRLVDVDSFERM